MGAKWVFRWTPANPGAAATEAVGQLEKAVLAMGGERERAWENTCTLYNPLAERKDAKARVNKDLYVVSFSDAPERRCLILRHERQVIDAEASVMVMLDKMHLYKQRLSIHFQGTQYSAGDFGLRIGKMLLKHTGETHGLMVELEYLPVSSVEHARKVLLEFAETLQHLAAQAGAQGKLTDVVAPLAEYPLPPEFSVMHSAVQHVALATAFLLKKSGS